MIKRMFGSLLLGLATWWSVASLDRLPYSRLRDGVYDALTLTGGFVAALLVPDGLDNAEHVGRWTYVALAVNVLSYVLGWFLILAATGAYRARLRRKTAQV